MQNRVKIVSAALVLNVAFGVIEGVIGVEQGALSLVSAAAHTLGDCLTLILVLIGFKIANPKVTLGIAALNGFIILGVGIGLVGESVMKIGHSAAIDGSVITWTALVGLLVNGFAAYLLYKGSEDISVKSAFLHKMADLLIASGLIVSGITISVWQWTMMDVLISLAIALIVVAGACKLLYEIIEKRKGM